MNLAQGWLHVDRCYWVTNITGIINQGRHQYTNAHSDNRRTGIQEGKAFTVRGNRDQNTTACIFELQVFGGLGERQLQVSVQTLSDVYGERHRALNISLFWPRNSAWWCHRGWCEFHRDVNSSMGQIGMDNVLTYLVTVTRGSDLPDPIMVSLGQEWNFKISWGTRVPAYHSDAGTVAN